MTKEEFVRLEMDGVRQQLASAGWRLCNDQLHLWESPDGLVAKLPIGSADPVREHVLGEIHAALYPTKVADPLAPFERLADLFAESAMLTAERVLRDAITEARGLMEGKDWLETSLEDPAKRERFEQYVRKQTQYANEGDEDAS